MKYKPYLRWGFDRPQNARAFHFGIYRSSDGKLPLGIYTQIGHFCLIGGLA